MNLYRVMVVGGYGFFGRRLAERLACNPLFHVIIVGRSGHSADDCAARLRTGARATISAIAMDVTSSTLARQLSAIAPQVLIHTSGPFQGQSYKVAEACIASGVHYIDLADGREFVTGISALNGAAAAAGVFVTSGASSVPALSCAVADHLACGMINVTSLDIGISPGNKTERGLSTVQAILSYCGKPLPNTHGNPGFGWSGTYHHDYPKPVARRPLSPCDVPDLTLLPSRYPGHPVVHFGAGLELRFLHRSMNLLALLAKTGLVDDWSAHASWLKKLGDLFMSWGTDAGAMHVTVSGVDREGVTVVRTWHLLAMSGDGPYVPTLAAAALVRKLSTGQTMPPGAWPCTGLLRLEDFELEASGLDVTMGEA